MRSGELPDFFCSLCSFSSVCVCVCRVRVLRCWCATPGWLVGWVGGWVGGSVGGRCVRVVAPVCSVSVCLYCWLVCVHCVLHVLVVLVAVVVVVVVGGGSARLVRVGARAVSETKQNPTRQRVEHTTLLLWPCVCSCGKPSKQNADLTVEPVGTVVTIT